MKSFSSPKDSEPRPALQIPGAQMSRLVSFVSARHHAGVLVSLGTHCVQMQGWRRVISRLTECFLGFLLYMDHTQFPINVGALCCGRLTLVGFCPKLSKTIVFKGKYTPSNTKLLSSVLSPLLVSPHNNQSVTQLTSQPASQMMMMMMMMMMMIMITIYRARIYPCCNSMIIALERPQ